MKLVNFWTKERCKEESEKYSNILEFRAKSNYVYVKSYRNNWLGEFYSDYIKPEIKWTKENCIKEAIKYDNFRDFQVESKSAYTMCLRNNWITDIHKIFKLGSYWTKENCLKESKKYKTKTEFKKYSYQAYKSAYINCWLDEICDHMPKVGNLYKRCIYAFEFPDNNVYIGLTYNIDIREKQHYISSSSQVNKHFIKSGLEPRLVKLTDYVDVNVARIKEGEYIQNYKDNNWYILNSQKAGNVGGNNKTITKEICKGEASKYVYLKDFRKEKPNIYKQIIRYKWYDVCDFLIKSSPSKSKIKWTKETCRLEALKYNTKKDFEKNNINAYNACVRNKWICDLCSHMINIHKGGVVKWTFDRCREESSKYKRKIDFKRGNVNAYVASVRNKWINKFYN